MVADQHYCRGVLHLKVKNTDNRKSAFGCFEEINLTESLRSTGTLCSIGTDMDLTYVRSVSTNSRVAMVPGNMSAPAGT